jgi:hypothetical protein
MKKLLAVIVLGLLWIIPVSADDLFKLIEREEAPKSIITPDPNYDFKKELAKEVNDLSMYLGQTRNDEKIPLVKMFYQTLQSNNVNLKEISKKNKDYFVVSGCRPQSCSEKSLLWIDKTNKIVIGAMVHYFLDSKASSKDETYLLIFSKKIDLVEDLPKQFKDDLKFWISQRTEYDFNDGKIKALKPTIINFINSKNQRSDIKGKLDIISTQ